MKKIKQTGFTQSQSKPKCIYLRNNTIGLKIVPTSTTGEGRVVRKHIREGELVPDLDLCISYITKFTYLIRFSLPDIEGTK